MRSKKILSTIIAFTLAFGTFAAMPEISDGAVNTAIEASAAEYYKTVNGFVLNKDSEGDIFVSDYTGKGGSITIPKEASYIGSEAFKKNRTITSVKFPSGTTKYGIGNEAFAWCTNLRTVTIEGNVGSGDINGINGGAFKGCHSLSTVTFSKTDAYVSYIGENAFFSCYNLQKINIPTNTAKICECAFENCMKLKSVTIPEKTKIEGSYTFGYMYGAATADDYYDYAYNNASKKLSDVKATGTKAVYWELSAETDTEADKLAKTVFGSSKDVVSYGYYDDDGYWVSYEYSYCVPVKQCAIVLNVTEGSSALSWAKKNGIKYSIVSKTAAGGMLDAPANLDATKTKNSVTLVWDDVTGADAYRVYVYDKKTGKYKKYKDVTSSKCKVTGLSANTTYKFKVVALKKSSGKYTEGEYSTISVTTKKS
ncbi:MAG: fibronectin type III domain-containing protein [Oscillospiraceae bacterium]|nr:fibronectin type III domain-containing protein [Oscillospiraceae bacterium]